MLYVFFFYSSDRMLYFLLLLSSTDLSHLPVLQNVLKQVYQWFNLGLQLGVPYHTLKTIEREQRERVEDSKREMLVAWLKGQGGESSRQFLETALKNIRGQCAALTVLSCLVITVWCDHSSGSQPLAPPPPPPPPPPRSLVEEVSIQHE